jgi:hypothetical protein
VSETGLEKILEKLETENESTTGLRISRTPHELLDT